MCESNCKYSFFPSDLHFSLHFSFRFNESYGKKAFAQRHTPHKTQQHTWMLYNHYGVKSIKCLYNKWLAFFRRFCLIECVIFLWPSIPRTYVCAYIHGSRWSKAISDMHRRDFPLKCLELLMKVLELLRSTPKGVALTQSLSVSNCIFSSFLLSLSRIFPFAFLFLPEKKSLFFNRV